MSKAHKARFVALSAALARHHPDATVTDVVAGAVLVDGRVVTNPNARVRADAAIRVVRVTRLKGDIKLAFALESFALTLDGRVAVDVGASAGGFTTALLRAGCARVYALDAGRGQLRAALRSDARVVDLGGHNLAELDGRLVPEPVGLVTVDLSYLSVAAAVPQLGRLDLAPGAELVALVKPTFELRRARLAATTDDVRLAFALARRALREHGWRPIGGCPAPRTGRGGAAEAFLYAVRTGR